ncbi:MAG: DUF1329 domain-containing protein [Pseudomonas profundi]|uniref:DUF1329 domain-containing protein n=1 Tax=Pseudomonas profundi TaxID=1981513 RepID=UPI003002E352
MKRLIISGFAVALMHSAVAAVTAVEAEQLGSSLTLFGAEAGANANGDIPAYTGGLTTAPAGYVPGSGKYVNPFADEKPLYSVSAVNMTEYSDYLTEGTKALMEAYPTFRVDVYQTHRTVAYPQSALESTKDCAVNARLTDAQGSGFTGGFNCVLFPIPQNGMEVIWNHKTRALGKYQTVIDAEIYNVGSNGRAVLSTAGDQYYHNVFWDPDARAQFEGDRFFSMLRNNYNRPTRRAGEMLLVKDPDNDQEVGRMAWSYLPGQRRVRLAPDVGHDSPNPSTSGMTTYDDNQIGGLERFDWVLKGKREMLVPYNNYDAVFWTSKEDLLTPHHAKPEAIRWEKHRVWIVEASLKEGQRHVYSKRRYYIDEDSWAIVAQESYDAQGNLWRVPLFLSFQAYDQQVPYSGLSTMYHDLNTSGWTMYSLLSSNSSKLLYKEGHTDGFFTAEEMAGSGVR